MMSEMGLTVDVGDGGSGSRGVTVTPSAEYVGTFSGSGSIGPSSLAGSPMLQRPGFFLRKNPNAFDETSSDPKQSSDETSRCKPSPVNAIDSQSGPAHFDYNPYTDGSESKGDLSQAASSQSLPELDVAAVGAPELLSLRAAAEVPQSNQNYAAENPEIAPMESGHFTSSTPDLPKPDVPKNIWKNEELSTYDSQETPTKESQVLSTTFISNGVWVDNRYIAVK